MPSLSPESLQDCVCIAASIPITRIRLGVSGKVNAKPKNPNDLIRVISPGGTYLGRITEDEAHYRIFTCIAKGVGGRGKREFSAVQMLKPEVADRLPGGLHLHYTEDLGNSYHLCTLKRYNRRTGEFHKWHPGLTFTDVRRGRMRPPEMLNR